MKNQYSPKICTLLIFVCFTWYSSPAQAAGVLGFDSVNEAIAAGIEVLYSYIGNMASELVETKIKGGDEYTGHQKIIMAEIDAQKKAQTSALAIGLKQNALAQIINKNVHTFSPLAQSNFACCSVSRGVGAVSGNRSVPHNRSTIYSALLVNNEIPTSTNHAYQNSSLFRNNPEFQTGTPLVPLSNTLDTSDLETAVKMAMGVTNPYPDHDIPADFLAKPAGEKYQALRRIKEAKLTIPQLAIAEILSRKSPVFPLADWMQQMNNSMGVSSTHPDVKNGMISADAMLAMDVAIRYANPAYIIDLHRKTKAGVLRELLDSEAVNMEFNRLDLVNQEYQSGLLAIRASSVAQDLNEQIQNELEGAVIQAH